MYRNIMVPLDGSAAAEAALPTAAELAKRAGARLHLVQVIGWLDEASRDAPNTSAISHLEILATRLSAEYGIDTTNSALFDPVTGVDYTQPPVGIVTRMLAEYLHDRAIDVCVMTTHGRGGLSRAWIGSVADGLLHEARAACVFIKPDTRIGSGRAPMIATRILVPVDLSERDEELLARVVEFGDAYGSELTLLHVVSPAMVPVAVGVEEMMDASEETREYARTRIDRLAETLVGTGHRVHTEIVTMPFAASEIVEYAQRHNFDLIATATRGTSGFRRAVLGSVADKVIRHATMPVLVCRLAEEDIAK